MNAKQIERYLNFLENQIRDSDFVGNANVGSLIVSKSRGIVSIGYNTRKTHPLQEMYKKREDAIYLHAEMDAIRKAARLGLTEREWNNSIIFVLRLDKNGNRRIAKPCIGCARGIAGFGIKNVVFTTDDGNYEKIGPKFQ